MLIIAAVGEDANNHASFFGFMGIAIALIFCNLGSAYGTAKSGLGICSIAVMKPEAIIKSVIPVVMAGIMGIYGLIVSVIILGGSTFPLIASQLDKL